MRFSDVSFSRMYVLSSSLFAHISLPNQRRLAAVTRPDSIRYVHYTKTPVGGQIGNEVDMAVPCSAP